MPTEKLSALRLDPKNARKHSARNIEMVESALREVGAARSIVIDETNRVLAGNATIQAAAAAGIERVEVVETDGDTLVAVRRRGLTPGQKTRLALYDNRTAELAEWELPVIQELLDSNQLTGLFAVDELKALHLPSTIIAPSEFAEVDETLSTDYCCPKCGYRWSGKTS